MACQGGNFLHGGVLPNVDLILRIAVGGDQLIEGLAEHQVADLRADVDSFDVGSGQGVSESDCSIGSASS